MWREACNFTRRWNFNFWWCRKASKRRDCQSYGAESGTFGKGGKGGKDDGNGGGGGKEHTEEDER